YPVRELTVLGGRAGGGELVEELGQLATRRAGVLARMAQLVEPAADLRDGAGVVVEVVSQQVLALDLRLEREPAAREVDELAQDVEEVGEAERVLVDVVATRQRRDL